MNNRLEVIASERSERSNLKSGIASSPEPALSEANVAPRNDALAAPRNDTIKKWPLSLFIIAIMLCPKFVFAAASISLSGSTWAIGTKGASTESTSTANAWIVTNDSGGTEDVNIKVSSTGTWTASTDGTQSVIDKFVLRKDSSAGTIITATDQTLVSSLANAGTVSFGLYFKTPISGSEQGAHTLTITLTAVAPAFAVLTSGTSWTVPAGITSVKFWAIGAGGGGAGVTASDGVSGGAGGAGGVCYKTYTVSPGGTVTYSLGSAGTAGGAGANGGTGGATTVTSGGVTITANGGGGGNFNNNTVGAAGTFSGGDGGANGGTGSGNSGDSGGGGGGGIGVANAASPSSAGIAGAQSLDVSGLFAVLTAVGGYPTTSPGAAGGSATGFDVGHDGGSATGFGCGGGGAGWFGGVGGNGLYGGGGGGAAGGLAIHSGGAGGAGVVVLSY